MKILFDTCVIIDALQKREPFFNAARQLLLAAARESVEPFITAKSVSDVYYLMHRHFHDDLLTRNAIGKLLMTMSVLDTTGIDVQNALTLLSGDFEDGIMMMTASRCGMDGIVTRNAVDYKQSAVKVYSPDELLMTIRESE